MKRTILAGSTGTRLAWAIGFAALCMITFAGNASADDDTHLIYIRNGSVSTEIPYTGVNPFINPLVPEDTIYKSANIKWVIWDMSQYNAYKVRIDSIIQISEKAVPAIFRRLGYDCDLPILAHIENESGWGGWAIGGGSEVGYSIGCFKDAAGMQWIKGVVIGELLNTILGELTDNWPSDWWCDGVWYFPGFVAIDVAKEVVDTAFAKKWEADERYPTYPVYNIFTKLLNEKGWAFYQSFFNYIKADTVRWGNIGANPSKIKTDYVITYLSLAAGVNMAPTFKAAGVSAADSAEVAAILSVRQRLVKATADRLNVRTAWTAYRRGDYAGAKTILDGLGVPVRQEIVPGATHPSATVPDNFIVYSLSGKALFSGKCFGAARRIPAQLTHNAPVIVCYRHGNKPAGLYLIMSHKRR